MRKTAGQFKTEWADWSTLRLRVPTAVRCDSARNTNVGECEGRGYPCVHGHGCRLSHENGHAHVGGCAYASDSLTIRGHGGDCAHACVDANLSWHWFLSDVELGRPSVSTNYTTASRICCRHFHCAKTKPLFEWN